MSRLDEEADILSMFGLTGKQTRILFSIEKLLVLKDILNSKNDIELKRKWLDEWSASILDYLAKASTNIPSTFMTRAEILEAVAQEHSLNINNTWYYLIMLEATLFVPYTALGKDSKDSKDEKEGAC